MDRSRLSLLIFPMDADVKAGKVTIEETLSLAKQAGIDYVDVLNVPEENMGQYLRAMESTGVQICTYIQAVSFLGSRKKRREKILTGLKHAKMLKARQLMIVPYYFLEGLIAPHIRRERVRKRMIEGFREAVELAKPFGIPVCFETTPHDASCLSGTADCLAVLDAVPGLNFALDTANMLAHGEDPLEAYEKLKGRISYVHLKDVELKTVEKDSVFAAHTPDGRQMKCTVWGRGVIPVREIYERMMRDGYEGLFGVEYACPENGSGTLKDHAAQLDRFLEPDRE